MAVLSVSTRASAMLLLPLGASLMDLRLISVTDPCFCCLSVSPLDAASSKVRRSLPACSSLRFSIAAMLAASLQPACTPCRMVPSTLRWPLCCPQDLHRFFERNGMHGRGSFSNQILFFLASINSAVRKVLMAHLLALCWISRNICP